MFVKLNLFSLIWIFSPLPGKPLQSRCCSTFLTVCLKNVLIKCMLFRFWWNRPGDILLIACLRLQGVTRPPSHSKTHPVSLDAHLVKYLVCRRKEQMERKAPDVGESDVWVRVMCFSNNSGCCSCGWSFEGTVNATARCLVTTGQSSGLVREDTA